MCNYPDTTIWMCCRSGFNGPYEHVSLVLFVLPNQKEVIFYHKHVRRHCKHIISVRRTKGHSVQCRSWKFDRKCVSTNKLWSTTKSFEVHVASYHIIPLYVAEFKGWKHTNTSIFALATLQGAINDHDQIPSDKQYTEQLLVAINITSMSQSEWEDTEKHHRSGKK